MAPSLSDLFPPQRNVYRLLSIVLRSFPLFHLFPVVFRSKQTVPIRVKDIRRFFTIAQWSSLGRYQFMGKTSLASSRLNLPGRSAWVIAESVGPLNMLYIMYSLPFKVALQDPISSAGILGTGLPLIYELMAMLYVLHYLNRAFVTPLFFAPSISPIHLSVALSMAFFQFMNSSCIACWLVYSNADSNEATPVPIVYLTSFLGVVIFASGMYGNISAEHTLFSLRRGAAKRKARSEGKATITYHKVYVIPPASGWFKYILFPHYVCEYFEWAGYWILGGGLGLGWNTPALWFLVCELATMTPRAVTGRKWYAEKFGARAVGGRGGVLPVSWL